MNDEQDEEPAALTPLPSRRFEGRTEFRQLIRDALAHAAREGWREIIFSDPDFADWPLGERAVTQSLLDWSHSGRRITLLARRYDEVVRQHARFVQWRERWSHIVTAMGCSSADALELPSAIWSPGWAMERLDILRCNGYCGSEPERRLLLRERLAERLAKSSPAFPATTLGL